MFFPITAKLTISIMTLVHTATALIVPQDEHIQKRQDQKFVQLPFEKSKTTIPPPTRVAALSVETLPLDSEFFAYYADLYLGTPPQKLRVRIDTGSSDTWIEADQSFFDPSKSSSFKNTSTSFRVDYGLSGQYSYAEGTLAYETFGFTSDGPFVENLEIGSATNTNVGTGLVGLGTKGTEGFQNRPYENLPYLLKKQNIISTTAYSLYLNSPDATLGSIIFGGIDFAKIDGNLKKLKSPDALATSGDNAGRLDVTVQSANVGSENYQDSFIGTLDSGAPVSYLPTNLLQTVVKGAGGKAIGGTNYIPCDTKESLSFNFGSITIDVPLQYSIDSSSKVGEFCELYLQTGDGDLFLLGDDFLRFAYTVYNLDEGTISFGKVKFTDELNIQAI